MGPSLERSDQRPQITTFNPIFSFSAASLTKSITYLADNTCGSSSYDRSSWYNHVGRNHRVGQYFRAFFDQRERPEDAVGPNVDVRVNGCRGDEGPLSDEDVVADTDWIVGWLTVMDPHRRV